MRINIEPMLHPDPQTSPGFPCPVCGGTVYPPGLRCIRCERRKEL